ncbi:MAG TPA: hypothetical protein DET40_14330 [Lentisphaeria bacterium]|nr:MAG: hypothetical protein A2X45_05505 [Lentisphaerae bacterium GWF2_50_93]HCE44715.1 hypothetical protein [Lentisphaeria bacterium]
MKNFLASFLLFLSICVYADEQAVTVKDTDTSAPEAEQPMTVEVKSSGDELLGKASPFRKETLSKINEILSEVEKNYPAAIGKYTPADEEKIIKSVTASLNSGIEYLSVGTAVPEEAQKESKALPAIIISSQKVLYIRIDSFTPGTFTRLAEDCDNTARLANKPVGLIIDLRNCQGYDYESSLKSLALFCPAEKVPKDKNIELPKRLLNIPVMVLVGNKTRGAGEIFTRLMSESGQCLVSGGGTSGSPFMKTKVVLKSGSILLIPSVPEYLSGIPAAQIIPATSVVPYPQIEYEKLASTAGSEDSDRSLLRAIDLLICLEALHKDQKKRAGNSNESPKKPK